MPRTNNETIHASIDLSDHGLIATSDGVWINVGDAIDTVDCETHHADDTIMCDQCCGYMHLESDDRVTADNGADFCSTECAENAGYRLTSLGDWTDDPPTGELQGYYDSSPRMDRTTEGHPFLIGIEVEKEDRHARDTVLYEANKLDWVATADSSLDDADGYELASPAYNLTENWDEMMGHLDKLAYYIDADGSSNCGTHITVSDYRLRQTETAYNTHNTQLVERLGQFPSLLALLYPTRAQNHYCEESSKRSVLAQDDRMAFVNATKEGRIEFRIFPFTKNVSQLKWRIRLVRWALENQGAACGYLRISLTNPASKLYKILAERLKPSRIAELAGKIDAKHRNYDPNPNYNGINHREVGQQWFRHVEALRLRRSNVPPIRPMDAYRAGMIAAGFTVMAEGSHTITMADDSGAFINEMDRRIWETQWDAYREEWGWDFQGEESRPYRYGEKQGDNLCSCESCRFQCLRYWRLFGYEAPAEVMMPSIGSAQYITRMFTRIRLSDDHRTEPGRILYHSSQYDSLTGDIEDPETRGLLSLARLEVYQLVGVFLDGEEYMFDEVYRQPEPEHTQTPPTRFLNSIAF